MGLRARRILQTYWSRIMMVARAGGYYRTAFQGARRVTQEYPISLTIFNVVVDAVVHNWVTVLIAVAEEQSEREKEGQGAFDNLVGLFDRVGLQTNVGKTIGMFC